MATNQIRQYEHQIRNLRKIQETLLETYENEQVFLIKQNEKLNTKKNSLQIEVDELRSKNGCLEEELENAKSLVFQLQVHAEKITEILTTTSNDYIISKQNLETQLNDKNQIIQNLQARLEQAERKNLNLELNFKIFSKQRDLETESGQFDESDVESLAGSETSKYSEYSSLSEVSLADELEMLNQDHLFEQVPQNLFMKTLKYGNYRKISSSNLLHLTKSL